MGLPTLYAILDAGLYGRRGISLEGTARQLKDAGVTLTQYRDKDAGPQEVLRNASVIRGVFAGSSCRLILNDRADLAMLAGWDGVHVGQEDMTPEGAQCVVGTERWVGISTHNEEQMRVAAGSCADYIAIGPVFATGTKVDAEPVIGLDGVRLARTLTRKPIVAIGGITRGNARSVIDAGADSVAVISALLCDGESTEQVAKDFLKILG